MSRSPCFWLTTTIFLVGYWFGCVVVGISSHSRKEVRLFMKEPGNNKGYSGFYNGLQVCDTLPRAEVSYHGIAARLDRLPITTWHYKVLWLLGGVVFCDCLDTYMGGGILAQLLDSGWSTIGLNAAFSSVAMFGYMVGALVAGTLSDYLGRKHGLALSILVFALANFCAVVSPSMEFLIACRGLIGLGLGGALPVAYGSLCEYNPPQNRGRFAGWIGVIGNFSPPLGALLTVLVIPLFEWRPLFFCLGVVGLVMLAIVLERLPESPRWLASQTRFDEADQIVAEAEHKAIESGIELSSVDYDALAHDVDGRKTFIAEWKSIFKRPVVQRTIAASAALFAMNLMVYTITNWAPTMFLVQGMDATISIGITVVMLIGAPFGIFFLAIFADKHDRKKGLIVCLLALAVLAYVWSLVPVDNVAAVMFIGFILCALLYYYALLACSVYLGEVFPTEIRLRGAGVAHAVGRIAGIVSPYGVAFLLQSSNVSSVFLIIGIVLVLLALVIGVFGVETRRKTLEEINDPVLEDTY